MVVCGFVCYCDCGDYCVWFGDVLVGDGKCGVVIG